MLFEYLPNLLNITDYVDLTAWTGEIAWKCEFTEFQLYILRLFSAVLCVVVALIVVYWCKYGEVISERFIRPISGTLKEIEELKLSVARLKLPREHTPRI